MAQPELIKDIEARVKKSGDIMTGTLKNNLFLSNDNNETNGGINYGIHYNDPTIAQSGLGSIRGEYTLALLHDCNFTNGAKEQLIGERCFYYNDTDSWNHFPSALTMENDGKIYYLNASDGLVSRTQYQKITMNKYEILHTGNTNLIDNRYVLKTGDTMTGMLRVNNAPIFGYRYGQSADAPAFILDKPSSHYSGIGANGSADTIYFGAVDSTFNWEKSYKQKWVFNGSVTADTFNGKATQDGNGNIITSTYLPLSGGTMSGRINLPYNTFSLQFRSSGADIDNAYNTGTYYGTLGNECLAFVARQAVTSFMFVTGSDPAGWTSSTWNSSSPALQIKGQSVYVNSLITNGVSPSYNFYVNGTSYFNGTVIATVFKGDTSDAGIRPQSSNEINFSSNGSTIWFGYRTLGSNAVSVYNFGNSSGSATGRINAGTVYGAVWNDYAEYRSSDPIEPGRVICETGNGILKLSTERLQPGANVVSDTFGFAIGETENCKTPIAVSGRALVYTYEDRYSYKAGDPVCAAPGGTVSKMSREEVMMYPDRIVGTVSEIPEYERWGTGNVEVKNRIWIKVK